MILAGLVAFASGCVSMSAGTKSEFRHRIDLGFPRRDARHSESTTNLSHGDVIDKDAVSADREIVPAPASNVSLPPLPDDPGDLGSSRLVQVAQTIDSESPVTTSPEAPPAQVAGPSIGEVSRQGDRPNGQDVQFTVPSVTRSSAGSAGQLFRSNSVDSVFGEASSILRNRIEESEQDDDEKKIEYPDIHADPAKLYQEIAGVDPEHDPFIAPGLVNLIFEDRWLLAEKDAGKALKNMLQRRMKIDIRDPDPDTANFPNGAYTLPKGRMYIETSPVGLYQATPSGNQPRMYQWEYLLRYGLTDNLEFRVFSNGLTVQGPSGTQSELVGYQPLALDFKANFWEENTRYHVPAMGIEVYLQTQLLGSSAFNAGTQPSINLLFDQSLPMDFGFEYNLGYTGVLNNLGEIAYQFSYQWSLQREVVKDFDVFFHGFYNAAALPRFNQFQAASLSTVPKVTVMGFGFIWTVNNRLATFGSYNFGLTVDAPTSFALLGFAYAL